MEVTLGWSLDSALHLVDGRVYEQQVLPVLIGGLGVCERERLVGAVSMHPLNRRSFDESETWMTGGILGSNGMKRRSQGC